MILAASSCWRYDLVLDDASPARAGCRDVANRMRFAYADPPYPGQARRHYKMPEVDHRKLLQQLCTFDAWALSTSSPALKDLLPLCPPRTRIAAWVKPFAFFKPKVWPAYAWEPVLYFGARWSRYRKTPMDWVLAKPKGMTPAERATLTCKGAKPPEFAAWLFELLGLTKADEFHDLFPGTGAVTKAWEQWRTRENPASTM